MSTDPPQPGEPAEDSTDTASAPPGPRFVPPPAPNSTTPRPANPPSQPNPASDTAPGPRFDPPPPSPGSFNPPNPANPPSDAAPGPQFQPPPPHPIDATAVMPPPPNVHDRTAPPRAGGTQFVPAPSSRPGIVTNVYDHQRATWGLGDMATSLAIYFVGSLALVLLIFSMVDTDEFLRGPWLLVGVVGPHLLLLAHLFWVRHTKGISFATDWQMRFAWSDVGLGLGLFFGALISAGIVAVAITEVTGEVPTASATELAQESGEGGLTIWLVLFAILGATLVPVVEELVYRGLLWSALEKRGMRPWMILIVTSAAFALIHLEPIRTAVLFVVGMAIGVGRLVTGRVGASIATHMFINAVAMTATLVELS